MWIREIITKWFTWKDLQSLRLVNKSFCLLVDINVTNIFLPIQHYPEYRNGRNKIKWELLQRLSVPMNVVIQDDYNWNDTTVDDVFTQLMSTLCQDETSNINTIWIKGFKGRSRYIYAQSHMSTLNKILERCNLSDSYKRIPTKIKFLLQFSDCTFDLSNSKDFDNYAKSFVCSMCDNYSMFDVKYRCPENDDPTTFFRATIFFLPNDKSNHTPCYKQFCSRCMIKHEMLVWNDQHYKCVSCHDECIVKWCDLCQTNCDIHIIQPQYSYTHNQIFCGKCFP